ncbi:MAG: mechanosensitive ion channel family protein [Candidatus Gracilibacteria bacterium]|jgi:small-conductance mechanosensitive channel
MAVLGETTSSNADFGSSSDTSGSIDWGNISGEILMRFLTVLEAGLILVVTYFITRWIRRKFEKIETEHEQQKTALNLMEKVTTGFTFVIGLTLALKTVGLDISLLVSVGLLGLSYGMKDIMKNYVAGILIFFKSPFKIGDVVKIKQFTGRVEKMDLQSISMKTFDNRDVTIYNSDIMVQSVANFSRYPMRRLEIIVRLGYGSDTNRALRIFDKILSNEPTILKNPRYSIVFKKFEPTGTDILVRFWIQMPANIMSVRSSIALQMQQAFDDSSIYIPYSRAIENENDRYAIDTTKAKVKEFYDSPLMADMKNPAPAQPTQVQVLAPEIVDADEPADEE